MFRLPTTIALLLFLSSCASKGDAPAAADPAPVPIAAANPKPAAQQTRTPALSIPKGAQYTIYAGRVEGDSHVLRADRDKAALIASTGMKDWYVVHSDAQSIIYYGFYRSINDPKDQAETTRAQTDRQKILLLGDKMGNRPFAQALFVELTAPDPAAPPQWDLTTAKGEWTLQIAVYKGSPDRKQAAVDAVAEARKAGVEAYYYHGESASLVCVGSWPESAVRVNDTSKPQTKGDPTKPLMVVPMSNDNELNQAFDSVARDTNMQIVRPQVEILDPTLEAAHRQYPHNHINGMLMKRNVNGQEVYDGSLIHRIPHTAVAKTNGPLNTPSGADRSPAYDPSYRPELPRQEIRTQPPPQNGGRLRSIGQ
ncbi:MAG TPA: hypothetical protein VHD56_01160 [Tepidisphaeraceae bacterium]|nr:hypothetical protein [Tepidisphaeraceae bacterium]